MSRWGRTDKDGRAWHASYRLGRLQVGWHIYKHTSPTLSDRWVFQPFAIYDRKDAS